MFHRPNRLNEICNELNKNGLYIDYYQQVFDKNTNKNRSVLICASFTKKEGKRIEDRLAQYKFSPRDKGEIIKMFTEAIR